MERMTDHKLILFEGIPGSGKTTAGIHLQNALEKKGHTVKFWREGNFDHPADFEGVARLSEAEYQNVLLRYPSLAPLFHEQLVIQDSDYLLWYRRLQSLHLKEIPQALIDELSRYDIYDGLPLEAYQRLILRRWRDFQRSVKDANKITILECCLLQNPLTVMFARHNANPQEACQHIEKIAEVIDGLNPLVIYLSPTNVRAALEHVRGERPKEWADFVVWYLTGQAYGESHHLEGYEGVIQFYEMRGRLELEILKGLSIPSLVLAHAGTDWGHVDDEIFRWVGQFLFN
jgi:hypothetical protein